LLASCISKPCATDGLRPEQDKPLRTTSVRKSDSAQPVCEHGTAQAIQKELIEQPGPDRGQAETAPSRRFTLDSPPYEF
jgi:hypothetical protein